MTKPRKFRPRRQFKFWLYMDKSEENRLIEFIDYSKRTRKFASMIRSGIRLMWSLGEGDTTVLFELFPHLEAQLASHFAPPTPPDNSDMQRQIENAVAAGVEKAIQNLPALPAGRMVAEPAYKELGGSISASAGIGSTLGQGRKMVLPTFDDEDDDMPTVAVTKSANVNNNGNNLLGNILAL